VGIFKSFLKQLHHIHNSKRKQDNPSSIFLLLMESTLVLMFVIWLLLQVLLAMKKNWFGDKL